MVDQAALVAAADTVEASVAEEESSPTPDLALVAPTGNEWILCHSRRIFTESTRTSPTEAALPFATGHRKKKSALSKRATTRYLEILYCK